MFLKGSIKSLILYIREDIEKRYHKVTFNTPSEIVKIVSVHLLYVKNMFIYYYIFVFCKIPTSSKLSFVIGQWSFLGTALFYPSFIYVSMLALTKV